MTIKELMQRGMSYNEAKAHMPTGERMAVRSTGWLGACICIACMLTTITVTAAIGDWNLKSHSLRLAMILQMICWLIVIKECKAHFSAPNK